MTIRIGTRKSELALWQARQVAAKLEASGIETVLVPLETTGDKVLDVTIHKIGSKGVFTEELEQALIDGEIDLAVHSAKDLQSNLPDGFEIIAFLERELPHDVLVSKHGKIDDLDKVRPLAIGTSSNRRHAFLQHYYPHIKIVPVRGNLNTRFKKLESGHCDALMLAYAGVFRMGFAPHISLEFSTSQIVPPVGQGSIAVEVHQGIDNSIKQRLHKILRHAQTELTIRAERAFLARLEGGCSIPAYGHARIENGSLNLHGGLLDLDGSKNISNTFSGPLNNPEKIGTQLGNYVLENGGNELLKKIRSRLNQ